MTEDDKVALFIIVLVTLISVTLVGLKFYTSGIQAKLYNEKFKTHYTASEFFFAGNTIRSFLNAGEQKTYNLNLESYGEKK